MMTPRERILAAIRHQPVDRIPTDLWATHEVLEQLHAHFGCTDRFALYDQLGVDGIVGVKPAYVGPETVQEEDYRENVWGMGQRRQEYGTGAYWEWAHHPLAEAETIEDLRRYRWPSPDWYDYSTITQQAAAYPDRAVRCGYTAVFYFHNLLRGLEQSLLDPLLKPELTHYIEARLSEFFHEYHRRCFDAGHGVIDITQVTDDLGTQRGLLISPEVFDTFYRAPMQRAIDQAKSYGIIVFHHDDGSVRKLLPTLVEMGIDVLNPVQWRCAGMDRADLKATFGEQICFHGAVDNQETLPFGTPEDVREEVRYNIAVLAADRTGYILAPCHTIQPNTAVENIIALYEAAREYGDFSSQA